MFNCCEADKARESKHYDDKCYCEKKCFKEERYDEKRYEEKCRKEERYDEKRYEGKCYEKKPCEKRRCQHVHEYQGSVMIADCKDPHTHRFAGMTGEAIFTCDSHVHKLHEMTDTYDCHQHILCETTGPAVWVACDRHIHFVKGESSVADCHKHCFQFATLIEKPTEK